MTVEGEEGDDAGLARRRTGAVALRRIGCAARDAPTLTRSGAHGGTAPRARPAGSGAHPVVEVAAHAGPLDGRRGTAGKRGRGGGRRRGGRRAGRGARYT